MPKGMHVLIQRIFPKDFKFHLDCWLAFRTSSSRSRSFTLASLVQKTPASFGWLFSNGILSEGEWSGNHQGASLGLKA